MSKKKYMKDVPCAYPFVIITVICFAVCEGLSLCCSFWGTGPMADLILKAIRVICVIFMICLFTIAFLPVGVTWIQEEKYFGIAHFLKNKNNVIPFFFIKWALNGQLNIAIVGDDVKTQLKKWVLKNKNFPEEKIQVLKDLTMSDLQWSDIIIQIKKNCDEKRKKKYFYTLYILGTEKDENTEFSLLTHCETEEKYGGTHGHLFRNDFKDRYVLDHMFSDYLLGKIAENIKAKGRGELKEDIKWLNHYVKEEEKQHRGDFIIQDALSFAKTTVNDK